MRATAPRALFLALTLLLIAMSAQAQNAPEDPATPPEPPEFVMSRVVVPVAGSVKGAGDFEWRTDVVITNPLASDVEVILTMPALPNEPFMMTTIPARATVALMDVARQAFGSPGKLSPLVVHTIGPVSVAVGANAYPVGVGIAPYRQAIPALQTMAGTGLHRLAPLAVNDRYRSNVGLVNLGEEAALITLAVQRVAGRNLAMTTIPVPPRGLVHASLRELFPLLPEGDKIILIAESVSSETDVYASVIDNESQRAVFVPRTSVATIGGP
ncbi:MAG: hypothetical protein ACYC7A_12885 [Thermoanaerobaculia bacterium]